MLTMNPLDEGYALETLELYNWGTFDKKPWRIDPLRHTALLTGRNGSGKSTLVDALLTLLVPNRKRTYNQASGDRRTERDEKTYVRGAFNRLRESSSGDGQVQYLRANTGAYSVLLAVFHSPTARTPYISLAQVLWYSDNGLNKFHVVARQALSFDAHFKVSGAVIGLKKSLRAVGAEVYDQFNEYSAAFRKLLGLRSEKALEIFSQTVSLKEVGSLNKFIREHMLEMTDAKAQIQQLRDNFHDLTASHDALIKARKQQEMLTPIIQNGDRHAQLTRQIEEATSASNAVPLYIAFRREELIADALQSKHQDLQLYGTELQQVQAQFAALDEQRVGLEVAIKSDETGRQLAELRKDGERLRGDLVERQRRAKGYNRQAVALDLALYANAATFHANRMRSESALPELRSQTEAFSVQRDDLLKELVPLKSKIDELSVEIANMRNQQSQIPQRSIAIRKMITSELHLNESDLPFVGELVRVRDNASEWEGAVERVLHGFALNILVSDQHYRRVSQYVNEQHLGGRLDYRRVESTIQTNRGRINPDMLVMKVEARRDSPHTEWLQSTIAREFDFLCVRSMDEFEHEQRAVTINGQIKHNASRHQKDDRRNIKDRTAYVLGWDNRAKLRAFERELADLQTRETEIAAQRDDVQRELKRIELLQDKYKDFLRVDDYVQIDWRTVQAALDDVVQRIRDLEASSNQLRELEAQLNRCRVELGRLNTQINQCTFLIKQAEAEIAVLQKDRAAAQRLLTENPIAQWQAQGEAIHAEISKVEPLTLNTWHEVQDQLRGRFVGRASNFTGDRNKIAQTLEGQITEFRMTYQIDTEHIGRSLGALPDLRTLLDRIVHDDLPKYETRFKELLDRKMLDHIQAFKAELERQEEEYRAVVDQLNESLVHIPYEASAYIQLQAEGSKDDEIGGFKQEMAACLDDTLQGGAEVNERAFERVRQLINRFEKEQRWTDKVSDVRNWLNFAAVELWRSDNTEKRYHSDSSGMSGGQKAKLAYTILASAVAYQYSITNADVPAQTFRFVVIDEAFSKVDDKNARYAMELFEQLGLQLLVVTPLDKIHVVEPFAGAYHLVVNNEDGSNSRVMTLTIDQFKEAQKQFVVGRAAY